MNYRASVQKQALIVDSSEKLLLEIKQAYRAFKWFRCKARSKTIIRTESQTLVQRRMELDYKRPDNIAIFWRVNPPRTKGNYVILATKGVVLTYSEYDPDWTREKSLELALASHAGISSGLTICIPHLLLRCCGDRELLFDNVAAIRVAPRCAEASWNLVGKLGTFERTITVRESDKTIVQLIDRSVITGGTVVTRTKFFDIAHRT